MMTTITDKASFMRVFTQFRTDAVGFVEKVIKAEPTRQQREALIALSRLVDLKLKLYHGVELNGEDKAYALKRGLSIMSGRGLGKDAFAAWSILWFMCCFPYPKNMATAPTEHQLKDVLWSEISKWIRHSERNDSTLISQFLEIQTDKIYFKGTDAARAGSEWMTVARTASAKASNEEMSETVAGFHADYMLFIQDEASGLKDPIHKAIEGTCTGMCNIIITIFNPTRLTGFAIENHTKYADQWVTLRWSALECERIKPHHIEQVLKQYGLESSEYRVSILGLPPHEEAGRLIASNWIDAAMNREIACDDEPLVLVIDPGRGGDPTIVARCKGMKVLEFREFNIADTMIVATHISNMITDEKPTLVLIDPLGLGWGIWDRLREMGHRDVLRKVNVAESASIDTRFSRLRDELWWAVRDALETGSIVLPYDSELKDELLAIGYDLNSHGLVKIWSKDKIRLELGRSTNKGDCVMMYMHVKQSSIRKTDIAKNTKDAWDTAFDDANKEKNQYTWMSA